MAVSGSKTFTITRTDIVNAAMRKIGAYDSGDAPSPEESADAILALNVMIKEWSARGIDVPWRESVTLFVQSGTQAYSIGPSGDHATAAYVETTLAADAVASDSTLTLTSTTGIAADDYIGIKLDDGSIHWTTVVDLSTTIGTGLASDASSGNAVYAYTTKANRPQKVVYANTRERNQDTPVELIGDVSYRGLSDKTSSGRINQAFYQPTFVNGTLFVWPTGGPDKLMLICQPLADTFLTASNNPQFPIEWGNALIFNLAADLSPEYGISLKERQLLRIEAREKLETVLDYDVENTSVTFGLDR